MRLLPATATVAPGLNSVAWASLISAVPRPRPRPQPLMNLFGDIFGGDDMLKAQVACGLGLGLGLALGLGLGLGLG